MKNIDPLNAIAEGDQLTPHSMVAVVKMEMFKKIIPATHVWSLSC
jgi:hypothetical protein